ncbi:MAG: ABC transporter ATP-binding protein [Elusimicrobia bacterium]|nr:ABC transporter ATP-binding protein [Elusimicrobiota bacterium]
MLEAKNITKKYFLEKGIFLKKVKPKYALKNVSLEIRQGEIVSLVGESGSGKSTLARILCGLERASSGGVILDGTSISSFSRREVAGRIGIVFQNPYTSLNPRLKVKTMISEVISVRKKIRPEPVENFDSVGQILKFFSLDERIAVSKIFQLSGGQCQKVAIARTFAILPDYLILDEVTSSLDVSTYAEVLSVVKKLNSRYNTAVLFITHDLLLAEIMGERIYVMREGEIVEEGRTGEVFSNPKSDYFAALRRASV